MNDLGITFIIPNWNHELVLPRAILSGLRAVEVLRSHGLDGRVLVVDDASRDGSAVLLRQLEALYYDQGFRALALRKNSGPAVARNHALRATETRYAVFMDADNELVHENIHAFYRSIRETEAAVVFGNLMVTDGRLVDFYSHESFLRRVFTTNHIDTFALCDVEQLFDVGGFWVDGKTVREDWELYMHLATSGRRLVHVPMVFGRYYDSRHSRIKDDADTKGEFERVFHQFPSARDQAPLNTLHLRYHPELGYL